MIEFKNVKLNIKNIDILNDITFKIEDNTTTCFVGSKNTGKSSLLKILAGINKKYSGEVYIDNVVLEDKKKKIGIVFDENEENTNFNVYEYLKFYCSLYNISEKDADIYIDKMLRKFLLMSYKYTNLELLDIETTKLVQITRAMIDDPDILLFDNVFIDENYEYNEKLISFFETLIGKKTLIFASRNLKHLEKMCDNIGILEAGNLIEFGDIDMIYKKAELNKKVEVELYDGLNEAIKLLKEEKNVSNITYDDDRIIFSIDGGKEEENHILKVLTDNNIKVYSYKKETVSFEQLFSKLREV